MYKPVPWSSIVTLLVGASGYGFWMLGRCGVEGQGFLGVVQPSEGQDDARHVLAYVVARRR